MFYIVIEECPGTAVAASIDVRVSVGVQGYSIPNPNPKVHLTDLTLSCSSCGRVCIYMAAAHTNTRNAQIF